MILVFTSGDGVRVNATVKMTGLGQSLTQGCLGRGGWSQPEEVLPLLAQDTPGPGSRQSLLPQLAATRPIPGISFPQDWYPEEPEARNPITLVRSSQLAMRLPWEHCKVLVVKQ